MPDPNTEDNPFPIAQIRFRHGQTTFGKDEVTVRIQESGPRNQAVYQGQLFLELYGLSRNMMSSALPALTGEVQTFTGAPLVSFNAATGIGFQQPNNVFVPQLIEYPLDISFVPGSLASFPTASPPGGPGPVFGDIGVITKKLTADLPETKFLTPFTLTANTELTFAKAEDPYFINVTDITPPGALPTTTDLNPFYFSQALRVITVTPELFPDGSHPIRGSSVHMLPPTFDPSSTNVNGAYQFCGNLLKYLNAEYADPTKVDPFDEASEVIPSQFWIYTQDSSVAPYTYGTGVRWANFNFALARVRFESPAGQKASNVRVFFRTWGSQTADTAWDPNVTYRSAKDTASVPVFPLPSTDLHTVPFFATSNSPNSADVNNPEYGPSGTGINTQDMITDSMPSNSRWYYFGCFLNFFDPSVRFNRVGSHHCLVAEIAYADTPLVVTNGIRPSPETSDKLAQRNLCVLFAENPGPATKLVAQPFDLRPSEPTIGGTVPVDTSRPDTLRIEWGDTPPDSKCRIYLPKINATDLAALASRYFGMANLRVVDGNTVEVKTTSTFSLIPIPPNTGENYAGLISVDLPMSVKDGQKFIITLKRVSSGKHTPSQIPALAISTEHSVEGAAAAVPQHSPSTPVLTSSISTTGTTAVNATDSPVANIFTPMPTVSGPAPPTEDPGIYFWGYESGVFALTIPVTAADNIIHYELDNLAISKWRLSQTPTTDRWYPVLQRYVRILETRVDGLTGTPGFGGSVPACADGAPINLHWPDGGYGGHHGGHGGHGSHGYGRGGHRGGAGHRPGGYSDGHGDGGNGAGYGSDRV